jgi:hypothetical protein
MIASLLSFDEQPVALLVVFREKNWETARDQCSEAVIPLVVGDGCPDHGLDHLRVYFNERLRGDIFCAPPCCRPVIATRICWSEPVAVDSRFFNASELVALKRDGFGLFDLQSRIAARLAPYFTVPVS